MTTNKVVDTTPAQPAGAALARQLYSLALELAVSGTSLGEAAETVRQRAVGDEVPLEMALTLAEDGCRDSPLLLAARQAMYVLGRALLIDEP